MNISISRRIDRGQAPVGRALYGEWDSQLTGCIRLPSIIYVIQPDTRDTTSHPIHLIPSHPVLDPLDSSPIYTPNAANPT